MANYRVPVLETFAWQAPVLSRSLSAPPGGLLRGQRWIVNPTGSGAWAGQSNKIATYDGSGWLFTTPVEGFTAWVNDEDRNYVFDGTIWKVEVSVPYLAIANKSAAYTLTSAEDLIRCTGTFTLSLPPSSGNGKVYYIKNKSTGKITVAADGTDKIDGSPNQKILNLGSLTIVDGAIGEWDTI